MILKEWSESQAVYKATLARSDKALRTIQALSKVKSYWYVWGAYLVLILSVSAAILFELFNVYPDPTGFNLWAYLFLGLSMGMSWLLMRGAEQRALEKEFAADYTTHGISRYPFWRRHIYFTYALFLQELRDRKYSHKQIVELASFSEIATPPVTPKSRLSQNPIIIYSMGAVMALVVNFVITSPAWQNETRTRTLAFGISVLGVVFVSLSFWYFMPSTDQHQTILRYLKWAEYDTKEEPFFN